MDAIQMSSCESDPMKVQTYKVNDPINFRNNSHSVRILDDLQSQRKNEVLCDVRFETDNGEIVTGHANVFMAASQYFKAMFNNVDESNKDIMDMKKIDSSILKLLINYIYTGEIMVTKENVQVLLPAANVLQLDYVNGVCIKFLQNQLDPSNCFRIKAFANVHNCTELLSSSVAYIKQHFLEVVQSDDFLSLSSEDVVKLISCNDLPVPFEEKVYACIMSWVNHELDQRKDYLPELMEHVRLPLLKPDILFNISKEPLLNNTPKCKDYVFDALQFNLKKSVQYVVISNTIRCKPRQFGDSQKVILMFSRSNTSPMCCTEWYYPATKLLENAPGINDCRQTAGLGVLRDQFVFVAGGVNKSSSKSICMLHVSSQSPSWLPIVDMLISRTRLGLGVLDDCIYAVGGKDGTNNLKTAKIFDVNIQKWRMVSSMTTKRYNFGVGILNNRLYAVGGGNKIVLRTVEYYDPALDKWTPVEKMSVCREGVSVEILDGLMYAIGGYNGEYLNSVEVYRPSDGVWSFIADMHICCFCPGVVALDGLLYVIGGETEKSIVNTVEMYDPTTNTWTFETFQSRGVQMYGGVVVNKPPNYN